MCNIKEKIICNLMADYQQKGIITKKKIIGVVLGLAVCLGMTGCASWDRMVTDMKSDVNGGYVKFDFNGKRYIYYNCFVESIADID